MESIIGGNSTHDGIFCVHRLGWTCLDSGAFPSIFGGVAGGRGLRPAPPMRKKFSWFGHVPPGKWAFLAWFRVVGKPPYPATAGLIPTGNGNNERVGGEKEGIHSEPRYPEVRTTTWFWFGARCDGPRTVWSSRWRPKIGTSQFQIGFHFYMP